MVSYGLVYQALSPDVWKSPYQVAEAVSKAGGKRGSGGEFFFQYSVRGRLRGLQEDRLAICRRREGARDPDSPGPFASLREFTEALHANQGFRYGGLYFSFWEGRVLLEEYYGHDARKLEADLRKLDEAGRTLEFVRAPEDKKSAERLAKFEQLAKGGSGDSGDSGRDDITDFFPPLPFPF